MDNPEYKYRCTKPLCSEVCTGYIDGFCISIENCAYKQERKTKFEKIKDMTIDEMAEMISDISECWYSGDVVNWLEREALE